MKNNETQNTNHDSSFFEKAKLPKNEWPAEWDEFDREAAEGLSMLQNDQSIKNIEARIDEALNENAKPKSFLYYLAAAASVAIIVMFYFLFDWKSESQLALHEVKSESKDQMATPLKESADKNAESITMTEPPGNLRPNTKESDLSVQKQGPVQSTETVTRNESNAAPKEEALNNASNLDVVSATTASGAKAEDYKDSNQEGSMDEISKNNSVNTFATLPPAPTTVAEKTKREENEEANATTKTSIQEESKGDVAESKKKSDKPKKEKLYDSVAGAASAPALSADDADVKPDSGNNHDLAQFILKSEPELKGKQIELILIYGDDLLLKEVQFIKWPKGYNDLKERVRKYLQENKSYYNGHGQVLSNSKERKIKATL